MTENRLIDLANLAKNNERSEGNNKENDAFYKKAIATLLALLAGALGYDKYIK